MRTLGMEYIGSSLSHATMLTEDLIPAFMDFLKTVADQCEISATRLYAIVVEVNDLEMEETTGYGTYYKDSETASYILNEDIWDLLNEIAPVGAIFSAYTGNGSDYGFWPLESHDIVGTWLQDTSGDHVIVYCEITDLRSIRQNGVRDIEYEVFHGKLYIQLKAGSDIVATADNLAYRLDYEDIYSGLYGDIVADPRG